MVAHRGFEPLISALRGRRPWPLDECAFLALTKQAPHQLCLLVNVIILEGSRKGKRDEETGSVARHSVVASALGGVGETAQ